MTVVKCKAFANKLKLRVIKARERRALEEKARLELEARNRRRLDYAKNLEKLTREDPSFSDSQLSIHHHGGGNNLSPPTGQALIASESVGSLLNLGHGQGQVNGSLVVHKREQQHEDNLRKGSLKQ